MGTTVVKEDYESRWDFMADRAGVPKESKTTDEEDHFQIVGTFEGDWEEEVNALLKKYELGRGFNFLSKLPKNIKPYTFDMDKHDMEEVLGISTDSEFVSKITPMQLNESKDICPSIWKMIDWFGFTGKILPKIHIQLPGQIFPYHFDDLTTHRNNEDDLSVDENVEKYARIEVQLFEWDYGQIWGVGNQYWSRWEKGEIMWHDWYKVPHGTANAGLKPRICLQITGEVTEELYHRLRCNNGKIKL